MSSRWCIRGSLRLAAMIGLTLVTGEAAAQEAAYPLRLALRPMTVPQRTIRGDAAFLLSRFDSCRGGICIGATSTGLALGGAYGILNELEVGATLLPLQLTETFRYSNPSIYGRYRFFRSDLVQVGADLRLVIPVQERSSAILSVGVPVWFFVNQVLQIQTGLTYLAVLSQPEISHGLSIPAVFVINATDALHLGVSTGLSLPVQRTDGLSMPLGFEVGYAFAGASARPVVDLVGGFQWPLFVTPGLRNTITTELWTINLTARFFFFV